MVGVGLLILLLGGFVSYLIKASVTKKMSKNERTDIEQFLKEMRRSKVQLIGTLFILFSGFLLIKLSEIDENISATIVIIIFAAFNFLSTSMSFRKNRVNYPPHILNRLLASVTIWNVGYLAFWVFFFNYR